MNSRPSGSPSTAFPKRLVYGLLGAAIVLAGLLAPLLLEGQHPQAVPVDASAEAVTPLEGPEMGPMLFRLVGGTVVVLALCVGVLWLIRRWLGVKAGSAIPTGLEIVESLPLVGPCRLQLVRVGGRYLLAGIDGSGLKVVLPLAGTLDEADEETVPAQPALAETAA